nr:CapA family protein [Nitrosomonas nitrosa]
MLTIACYRIRCAAVAAVMTISGAALAETGTYRIIGVGDTMMGSDYPAPVFDARLTANADPASIIGRELAAVLKSGDIVFANYEGTIHSLPGPAKRCNDPRLCYVFRSPPFHADVLKRLGFNIVSLANNHSGDFGDPGRIATYETFRRIGIAAAGPDRDGMRTAVMQLRDGTRVGFAAFGHNPGLMWLTNIKRAQDVVRDLRKSSDIVLISVHAGAEGANALKVTRAKEMFVGEDRGNVFEFARAVVDAGADVVLGHGPHVPRAVEVYKGKFIAYSLGNFWTYGRFNLRPPANLAPIADIEVDKRGRIVSAKIHSAIQDMPGVPRMDRVQSALKMIARLTAEDFPDAGIRFMPDGRISAPGLGGGR